VQSAILKSNPQQLVMQNLQYLMGILLFIPPPEKILLLGVGAGSLVQFFKFHFPETHITGVDLDAQLLELAHQNMLLPTTDERLEYIIQDARHYIAECTQQYDLIVVDIFNGSQSPGWVLQREFTQQLKDCLSERGAVAYNLLINSERGFQQFYSLLRQVFRQQTLCLESEKYANLLLYGLNFVTQKKSMTQLLQLAQQAEQQYSLPFNEILSVIYSINPQDCGVI
jgi:spermidine synthase